MGPASWNRSPRSQVAEAIVGPEAASPRQEAAADKTRRPPSSLTGRLIFFDQFLIQATAIIRLECG